ncbi:MAG: hypothetical protein QXU45_05120 [Candidatus Bathyarchaeia archaeon]
MLEAITRRLKRLGKNKLGISNVLVVMLSLILITVIVANVVLWNYQMNQLDIERMHESINITNANRITRSQWFTAQNEFTIITGTKVGGNYADTKSMDNLYESFREEFPSIQYNPSNYTLGNSTKLVSGEVANLKTDNGVYMTFGSYAIGDEDFVDQQSDVDGSTDIGTHSNFNDLKSKDNSYDILTEANTGGIFGKTAGSGTNYISISANRMYLGVYPCSVSGYVTRVQFYGRGAVGGYVKAIITDSGGNILANGVSDPTSFPNSVNTYTCIWSDNKPYVSAGNTYWIGIIASVSGRLYYDSTTGGNSRIDSTNNYANPTSPTDAVSGTYQWRLMLAIVVNYQLDLEVQWTNVNYTRKNEQLCIYAGILNSENLRVDVWTGSSWAPLINALNMGWNNVSVSDYLVSDTFTIRFKDAEAPDATQSSWQIDCVLLHTWGDSYIQVEFRGTSNTESWTQLVWTIDCSSTVSSVNVTFQLYDYETGEYPTSRDGYMTVTVGIADITLNQTITANPTRFRDADGSWKMKITGEGTTPFNLKIDLIELKATLSNIYRLEITNNFTIDLSAYPLNYVYGVEILVRYNVSEAAGRWFIKAYDWASESFSDAGFNVTEGDQPAANVWNDYAVSMAKNWTRYIRSDGTVQIMFCDEGTSENQTLVHVDFVGVRVILNGISLEMKNSGATTAHIVSIWVINATHHMRYDADFFINSGESATYIRVDIPPPAGDFTVKIVTERGNIDTF